MASIKEKPRNVSVVQSENRKHFGFKHFNLLVWQNHLIGNSVDGSLPAKGHLRLQGV